ncbi:MULTISPECIES: hypothetical protein [unclassified Sphingobacterium]|uniref:hypothetical protein n=1 Tax=unclassified Sphingobacterium TaxID=2609468 RepID=UPI0025F23162|nr:MULTISPECIES: hypothetical protein [unclassified Sphingobacterium]
MKALKYFLVALCTLFILNSCSTTYLTTIDSQSLSKDAKSGKFVFENDTIKIEYGFNGSNTSVHTRITNKLGVPIAVDLGSSALVVNGQAISYSGNEVKLNARVNAGSWTSGYDLGNGNSVGYSSLSGNVNGSATLPKSMLFVPPHSYIENNFLSLKRQFGSLYQKPLSQKVNITTIDGNLMPARFDSFSVDATPMNMESYLTFAVVDKVNNKVETKTTTQKFYVSRLMTIKGVSQLNIPEIFSQRNDVATSGDKSGQNQSVLGGTASNEKQSATPAVTSSFE